MLLYSTVELSHVVAKSRSEVIDGRTVHVNLLPSQRALEVIERDARTAASAQVN